MSDVIEISEARAHYRASSIAGEEDPGRSRAASAASLLTVNPAARARSVRTTAHHQAAGMLSRCHHLLTMNSEQPSPISDAQSTRFGQSSMIERHDASSVMPTLLGRAVLKGKVNLSHDCGRALDLKFGMTSQKSITEFEQAFISRTAAARRATGMSQTKFAKELGLEQGTYKNYESGRPLPHHLIPKFCDLTGTTIGWLYSAHVAIPNVEEQPKEARGRPRKQRKAA